MRKKNIYIQMIISLVVLILVGCGKQSDAVFVSADGACAVSEEEKSDATGEATEGAFEQSQTNETKEGKDIPDSVLNSEESVENDSVVSSVESESLLCYVHVCGAVVHPGVYQLKSGSRVYEAIQMAGGVTDKAYDAGLNQASVISDGDRIVVPTIEEWEAGLFKENVTDAGVLESGVQERTSNGLVNLNTASKDELCTLQGIGESRAEAIISYREQYGKFTSIEEIQNVSGIKEGLYNKIKDRITVS